MSYLNKNIDYIKNNLISYNLETLLNFASAWNLYSGFSEITLFFVLIFLLFYKNISFSKNNLNKKNFLHKNIIILFSFFYGVFCVAPYLIFKIFYLEIEELALLIQHTSLLLNEKKNYIFDLFKTISTKKNNYPNELINSKFYFRTK